MKGNQPDHRDGLNTGSARPAGDRGAAVVLDAPPWTVFCDPADGGRITRLSVAGRDLLTAPPRPFRPPADHPGRYETRPVFGYDDCWPTVDPCPDPGGGVAWADHGALCWQPWRVSVEPGELRAETEMPRTRARFVRRMHCKGDTLQWRFSLTNDGERPIRFLHVMHGLMPISRVAGMELPSCEAVIDEVTGETVCAAGDVAAWLLARPEQTAEMVLLRQVRHGCATLHWAGGGRLDIRFCERQFPTLAIWWNRGGFPGEDDLRRSECAFEPMAGPWSSLARSADAGATQVAPPKATVEWSIDWIWKGAPACH